MSTLYELTNEYQELLAMMEDPEVDPEVLTDTMEGIQGEIEIKAEGYVIIMKELEAQAEKFNTEIKRLTERKASLENNVKRMKNSLLTSMQAIGKDKIPTEHFKISIAKNGGLQPMKLADLSEIPDEYIIKEPKADTKKIRDALAAGKELSFATLEERGVHLSVR